MKMDSKIMLISPYRELAELANNLNKKKILNIIVRHSNMPDCLKDFEDAKILGVEAIITRGGNAILLKNIQNTIPVIELSITSFDILEAIQKGLAFGDNKMGIVGFQNIINGIERVQSLLNLKIRTVVRRDSGDCHYVVKDLKNEGFSTIIGDAAVVKKAKELGLNTVLIETAEKSLIAACEEAERLIVHITSEKANKFILEVILDCSYEAIISSDTHGIIKYTNLKARTLFGKSDFNYDGLFVGKFINVKNKQWFLEGIQELGEVGKIGDKKVVINKIPIMIGKVVSGLVITVQEIKQYEEVDKRIKSRYLKKGHVARENFESILGVSKSITRVKKLAESYSKADAVCLIQGETGTGKELFAQSIHNSSSRSDGPFVAINCAALPRELLESELFGYVRGSFTGSLAEGKTGLFEIANYGTIFLDEISELPLDLQAKLLRVIQENQIRKIGDDKVISIDVRIVAATNQDLTSLINNGKFREDLYYRLNILNLKIPPLRERREDIHLLAQVFLEQFSKKYYKPIKGFQKEAIRILNNYDWPGNIRQLKAEMEKTVVTTSNIYIDHNEIGYLRNSDKLNLNIKKVNKDTILEALKLADGKKTDAAKILGINRTTLWRKLKQFDI